MKTLVLIFLASGVLSAHAQGCPELQGTFQCRDSRPFNLTVVANMEDGELTYTMTDPTGSRTFVPDGRVYFMNFSDGRGEYRARCEGNSLLVEGRNPKGETFADRYYIERSALVRVRRTQTRSGSLSCAPTHGTWNRYQRPHSQQPQPQYRGQLPQYLPEPEYPMDLPPQPIPGYPPQYEQYPPQYVPRY